MTMLEQLRKIGGVVADSSDLEAFRQYAPISGITTNPTLILKGIQNEAFPELVSEAVKRAHQSESHKSTSTLELAQDWLLVLVADKLSEYADGWISVEADARAAYDTDATYCRACQIMDIAASFCKHPDRLLVKIAATWEGIKAAEKLESNGIHCNMTLLFDFYQAVACAQAQATLVSPFVGRIYDWYKQKRKVDSIAPEDDPGIESVKRIYNYYKRNRVKTLVMAASFRTIEQIEHLAGCDLLTIAPDLLNQLHTTDRIISGSVKDFQVQEEYDYSVTIDEDNFRHHLANHLMASEKLKQGIEQFAKDQIALEKHLGMLCN